MPWELTVRSALADPSLKTNDTPLLGQGEGVCRRISESLPTVRWRREPSFIEQHQHLPDDHPIRKFIDDSTVEQREWSSRPQFKGLYEGEAFTLEFFLHDGPISFFHIDLRGGGNPLPSLIKLCRPNQWAIQDVAGKAVDRDSAIAPGWQEFMQWRDGAINQRAAKRQTEDAGD